MSKRENRYFIFDKEITSGLKRKFKDILYYPISLYYKISLSISHPKVKEKKYNVSICAIFKNEAQYLKEWIEFNTLSGIEHFYLYNNNSEDNFDIVLEPYIKSGLVTLLSWEKDQAQMECYKDGIARFKDETKWLGFIDIDEFVVPIKSMNIYELLNQYDNKRGTVVFYWKMFCSSGLMDRDRGKLVTESFTVCWPKMDTVGKCFYNTSFDIPFDDPRNTMFHHSLWTSYKGKIFPPVNSEGYFVFYDINKVRNNDFSVQINHYFTKSFQEYKEKKSKGDVYFKINPHDEDYFYRHEMLCTSVDYKIFKYLIKLKNNMRIEE